MAAQRRAGIDIGTNTILLLVAEVEDGKVQSLSDNVRVVRLGQGVDKARNFHPDAMERARACFTDYAKILDEFEIEYCRIAATSGSRDAENSRAFFDEMEKVIGFPIEVISGEREAELSFQGTLSSVANPKGFAIVDIGGGSTEIVCYGAEDALVRKSFDIGCVRVKEKFLHSDPPTKSEMDSLSQFAEGMFAGDDEIWTAIADKQLVGVAGTATYLSSTNLGLSAFEVESVDNSKLTLKEIDNLVLRLQGMTSVERLGMGGMDEGRADVIHGGAVILRELLKRAGKEETLISIRGLRYGLVL